MNEEVERRKLDSLVPGVGSSSILGRDGSGEGLAGSDVAGLSSTLVDESVALGKKGVGQISKRGSFSFV